MLEGVTCPGGITNGSQGFPFGGEAINLRPLSVCNWSRELRNTPPTAGTSELRGHMSISRKSPLRHGIRGLNPNGTGQKPSAKNLPARELFPPRDVIDVARGLLDMIELEALIGQYNPGIIFVGPVLDRWDNPTHRYFEIAGNGSEVYRRIDLGRVRATEAQRQRAEIVEKLGSRFLGVVAFASTQEMAQAVYSRWPNNETAKILLLLAPDGLEAQLQPTNAAEQHDPIDARSAGVVPAENPSLFDATFEHQRR
jgi:hypothetical protein